MPTAPHPGFFLTFEGLDGSGKTTQITLLKDWLTAQGIAHLVTRQPGGTATGDRIRALLLDANPEANLDAEAMGVAPLTELAMMFADRVQAIEEVIRPALISGKLVVCDRFTDSTEAYQGGGRQLGSDLVLNLHRLLCGDFQPDLTLLLLPSLSASLNRARRRNSKTKTGHDESRFEREQDPFFERVLAKYLEIVQREPARVLIIDGDLTISEVHDRVVSVVKDRLTNAQII